MEVCWSGPQPRRFADPHACLEAFAPADVAGVLAEAEAALADGYSIAGYLAYEAGAALVQGGSEVTQRNGDAAMIADTTRDVMQMPLVALGVYPPRPRDGTPSDGYDAATAPLSNLGAPDSIGPLVAQIDERRYAHDLAAIAAGLHAGDVYQVNYTVPFAFTFDGDVAALFAALRVRAHVPYAALVRHRGHAFVSLSPERFFSLDGDRITTQPMKGTAAPNAREHLRSAKNRAEHVMIVDLLRNDMHRICDEVMVDPLFAIETFPTFATMTSTLVGHLRADVSLQAIFGALFPCGSITGAPKGSAMRAIAHAERAPRGISMGTIGYCDGSRRGTWSVAIRTAAIDETARRGELRIGGGIVADSDARDEWAEILVKRRAFDACARRVGLIETLRVEADGTLAREAAHCERLARAAFALGIPHDESRVADVLATLRGTPRARAMLARLELATDGTLTITQRDLIEAPPDAMICVSRIVLQANDPALRYKTTARDAYDAAAAEAAACDAFDALILNERGEFADGARTTLFVESDGTLLTPPLDAGAFAGMLRADLLASGRAREARLVPDDLRDRPVWLGNAARGLISVRLANAATGLPDCLTTNQ